MSKDEREFLKCNALELIAEGTGDVLEEQLHVKDAVSRVTVELMKHEWPNLWPSLLQDLYKLCLCGPAQTELVMKIFLRLVEDVVTFQNLQSQRRREIMLGLTSNMGDIFNLFVTLLQEHISKAEELMKSSDVKDSVFMTHVQVSNAILLTLTGYVDWVTNSHLFSKNCLLLQMLCLLLSNDFLQLQAVECLLVIICRKGKLEERKPLMILFSKDAMSVIFSAAVAADSVSGNEHFYLFLKRLCQVITEIGKQLCALWGSAADVSQPPNFQTYLDAVLEFTKHPSQMLSSLTQTLWALLLRHEHISKDPIIKDFIPKLVQSATKTLCKYGYPSQNNSRSCDYARLDFDNDEDFSLFFSKYRTEVAETLRLATMINPVVAFSCAEQWLKLTLQKPVVSGEGTDGNYCNLSSPSFVEWDALTVFLESVLSKLMLADGPKPDVSRGIQLLQLVLDYESQDPLILSCLLSCISALFIFLQHTPETLPKVLEKMFSAVVFNLSGQTKATRSRAVKNVRQHACSGLVKICKQYQTLIFPVFDQLYNHVQEISRDPDQLSQMEKCILVEALILVSNQFANFEKQSKFVEDILADVKVLWLSQEFKSAIWVPDKFMSYVGLDQPPVEPSSADTCGINRSHINLCIYMILAVLKRSKWPEDSEKAKQGGFVIQTGDDCIFRNPATRHIITLLENVLALLKTMNSLWLQQYQKLRHIEFAKANDLLESEKHTVLGIRPMCIDNTGSPACKQPLERMQTFLTTTHDMCCHILGNAGQFLGHEFYAIPNLAQSVIGSVLDNLDSLPDYRLRPVIRVFMKSFFQHCPNTLYSSVALPILAVLCPYMFQRLTAEWQQITALCQTRSENDEDENPESQEVLDEQLARQLTREYFEMLAAVCYKKNEPGLPVVGGEEQMMQEDKSPVRVPAKEFTLGELGALCLATEAVCPSLVMCVFCGMTWNDTMTCNKSINICWPLLKGLLAENKLTPEAANHFYCAILTALQLHGQDEGSQAMLLSLGLNAYELLRPHFVDLQNILLKIPKCTPAAVKNFEDKFLTPGPQKVGEKKKKELFKKLVSEVIGKNVGQQFKREVQYKSLPPLFRMKPKPKPLEEEENADLGICELFKAEDY